ncbi:hypothetical protein LP420_00445 [Massilia sp. B-10]|nr:hypothetical protein LP420_00445 [Massilia sp. B-10]
MRLQLHMMAEKFSSNWWSDFLAATEGMSAPAVLPNSFDPAETRQMRMAVMGMIRDLHTDYKRKYGYRLWVGGRKVDDERDIFRRAPLPGEDLDAWVQRIFVGEKFGIILNRGEKFSDAMSSVVARHLPHSSSRSACPAKDCCLQFLSATMIRHRSAFTRIYQGNR